MELSTCHTAESADEEKAHANEIKHDLGPYEVEVFFRERGILRHHKDSCLKNPSHTNFHSIEELNLEHFPEKYRKSDLVSLAKELANSTVLITSKHVSQNRPLTLNNSEHPYPFAKYKGNSSMSRCGTGSLMLALKFSQAEGRPCPCQPCTNSEHPRTDWGRVWIKTAAHVIYDTSEGKETTCHLFYDSPDIDLDKCSSLSGATSVYSDVEHDWSVLSYVTHNLELIDRLHAISHNYWNVCNKVRKTYMQVADPQEHLDNQYRKIHQYMNKIRVIIDQQKDLTERQRQEDYLDVMAVFKTWCDNLNRLAGAQKYQPVMEDEDDNDINEKRSEEYFIADHRLTIIASHPHGGSKLITVGETLERNVSWRDRDYSDYSYTTPTCPGSSGAPVFILGRCGLSILTTHPHSHNDKYDEECQVNRSGKWLEM